MNWVQRVITKYTHPGMWLGLVLLLMVLLSVDAFLRLHP